MERGGSLSGVAIVIAILALLLGVALANADVLNPYRGPAQAREIELAAEIGAERARMELEAQRQEIQIRLEGLRQKQETEQALLHFAGTVLTLTAAGAILMVGGGAAFYLIALGRRAWIVPASPPLGHMTSALPGQPVGRPQTAVPTGIGHPVPEGGNGRGRAVNRPVPYF